MGALARGARRALPRASAVAAARATTGSRTSRTTRRCASSPRSCRPSRSGARSARAATSRSGSRASRPPRFGEHELELYWLDAYGGGLFLPFRDATAGERDLRRRPLPARHGEGRRPRRGGRQARARLQLRLQPVVHVRPELGVPALAAGEPDGGSDPRRRAARAARAEPSRRCSNTANDGFLRPSTVIRPDCQPCGIRAVVEQEPREEIDTRVRERDLVRLAQVLRLLRPADAEEVVGRAGLVAVLGDPQRLASVEAGHLLERARRCCRARPRAGRRSSSPASCWVSRSTGGAPTRRRCAGRRAWPRGGTRSARSRGGRSPGRSSRAARSRRTRRARGHRRRGRRRRSRCRSARSVGRGGARHVPFTRTNCGWRKTGLFGSFQASHRPTRGSTRPLAMSRKVPL